MELTEKRFLQSYNIVFVILLGIFYGHCVLEPRMYLTRYGRLKGMLIQFQDSQLGPVEVISGLQYAWTRRKMLQFMPPINSLEKWLGIRIFTNVNYRGICPQKNLSDTNIPKGNIMEKDSEMLQMYFFQQREDCLSLNLYIPFRGKQF